MLVVGLSVWCMLFCGTDHSTFGKGYPALGSVCEGARVILRLTPLSHEQIPSSDPACGVRTRWLTNQLLISKQKPLRLGKCPLKSMEGEVFEIQQEKHQKGTLLKCLPASKK